MDFSVNCVQKGLHGSDVIAVWRESSLKLDTRLGAHLTVKIGAKQSLTLCTILQANVQVNGRSRNNQKGQQNDDCCGDDRSSPFGHLWTWI